MASVGIRTWRGFFLENNGIAKRKGKVFLGNFSETKAQQKYARRISRSAHCLVIASDEYPPYKTASCYQEAACKNIEKQKQII
jgi:Na+-translocating ferredoxin:NAD+ oxidoreductase RnfC subunit